MNEPAQNLESRVTILETEVLHLKRLISSSSADQLEKAHKKMSIKEFLLTKNIDNDVKRTLAIAYYLEKFEGLTSFNVDDIERGYRLAKHAIPANPNDKVNMSIRGGLLMEAEGKKDSKKAWTLTASGEKAVEDDLKLTK